MDIDVSPKDICSTASCVRVSRIAKRTALMIIPTGSKQVFLHPWELFFANSGRNNKLSYKIKPWISLKLMDIRP